MIATLTGSETAIAILTGLAAGLLSGLFGVGGGSIMTPALAVFLGLPPLMAVATPLPVIMPTAAVGANNYRRASQIDWRACRWAIGPGLVGAIIGALAADWIDGLGASRGLLIVTAVIVAWESVRIIRGRHEVEAADAPIATWALALTGFAAGIVSGLLGVGGGIVMVPVFTAMLHMPLKRALGTSLAVMIPMVIPGMIVHASFGNIDWGVAAALVVGVVPGAWAGSRIALRTGDRTLRLAVGSFLLCTAVLYGALEIAHLLGWGA